MRRLFLFLLFLLCLLSGTALAQSARLLRFDEPRRDLGRVAEADGKVMLRFQFENIDSRPVTILEVHTQCGCLNPLSYPRKAVAAGGRAAIDVEFDPARRSGDFSIGLTVISTNGEWSKYNTLVVSGYVVSIIPEEELRYPYALDGRLRADVGAVGMRQLSPDDPPRTRSIKLFNNTDKRLKLMYVPTDRRLKIDGPEYIEPRAEAVADYTLDPQGMPLGEFVINSTIAAGGIPVKVKVKGLITTE